MSALLLDEQVIAIQPALVRLLGGHDLAAFVQQVHFRSTAGPAAREHDGHRWAVMTIDEWCADVVLTPKQMKRIVTKLTGLGVIVREAIGAAEYDRTKWTRVDVHALENLLVVTSKSQQTHCLSNGPKRDRSTGPERDRSSLREEHQEQHVRVDPQEALDLVLQEPCRSPNDRFEEFWKMYPRTKVRKADALGAWKKAVKRAHPDVIIEATRQLAEWYRKSETPDDRRPHAATWLNGSRWDDELGPIVRFGKPAEGERSTGASAAPTNLPKLSDFMRDVASSDKVSE